MPKRKRRSFTSEFKAKAIQLCKDRSIREVVKDLDVTEKSLREWVKRSDAKAGNHPKRKRRSFTSEFKAEAVRLCKDGSIREVAKDLDLTETALREWVMRAEIEMGKGPSGALTKAERDEFASLRKQVKRLETLRALLETFSEG